MEINNNYELIKYTFSKGKKRYGEFIENKYHKQSRETDL